MAKTYTTVATFPSSSKSGKVYEVKVDEQGRLSCSCPVYVYNQKGDRSCYHTLAYLASCQGTMSSRDPTTWPLKSVGNPIGDNSLLERNEPDNDGIVLSKITGEAKRKVRLEGR